MAGLRPLAAEGTSRCEVGWEGDGGKPVMVCWLARTEFSAHTTEPEQPDFAFGYAVAGFVSDNSVENEAWCRRRD